jgi:hypothetical protein
MKTTLQRITTSLFISFLLLITSVGSVAQTVFSENMGTATATTPIATNVFQNAAAYTYLGTADVRNTTVSSVYTGFSAGANVFFTNVVGRNFQISGINTASYTSLVLSFGQYKSTTAANNELLVEVSADGTTYSPLTYSRPTGAGTANWVLITASGSIPSTANLRIRFTQTSATPQFRLDDVKLVGVLGAASPTITTTSPATSITATSATMAANVTNIGGSAVSATGIVYAETSLVPTPTIGALSVTNLATASPNAGTGTFSQTASGLSPNTQYSFRGYATNGQGTSYGSAATFYTLANVPTNPVVNNPTSSSLNVTIGTSDGNPFASNTQYAIQVNGGLFVQASGALGASPVWQTAPTWGTKTVTGLTSNTLYIFAVKARNGANIETITTGNVNGTTLSNLVATLTLASTAPALGSVCLTTSAAQNFSFNGLNLNSTDFSIAALAGFTFSLSEFGTYTSTLIIPNASASVSGQVVWVKFSPTLVQSYNGNISISGGGLPSAFLVAVTGSGVNTPAIVTTGSSTTVTSSGATLSGSTLESCSSITNLGIEYSLNNLLTGSTSVNGLPATLSGLLPNTQYFYRAFAIDASGTVNGTTLSFTTANLDAPVATAATAIQDVSFVANWNAVAGATSYKLDVSDSPTFGSFVPATDLIISEYLEGTSNNKAIEIYNGTGASVNLANYSLKKQTNGAGAYGSELLLSGTLAHGATYVIANTSSNASILAKANLTNASVMTFNGNDAVALYKSGTQIDVVGIVNQVTPNWGIDVTLVRNASVVSPTVSYSLSDWTTTPANTDTNLGLHTMNNGVASYLPGYENLSVSGTSQMVTGLTLGTTYYYRVVASSVSSTSTESNVISVVTVLPTKTNLNSAVCGTTLPFIYSSVATPYVPVSGITGYRFKAKNMTTLAEQTIDRGLFNWFRLNQLPVYDFATTYEVSVELQRNGVWLGYYGNPCSITTPGVPVINQCGQTIAAGGALTTTALTGVTQYTFQVTNIAASTTQTFNKPSNILIVNQIPGYLATTSYSVSVAIKTANGVLSAFGVACEINPAPATRFGTSVATKTGTEFKAVGAPNPFESNFTLSVTTVSDEKVQIAVYDMIGKQLESKEVTAEQANALEVGVNYPSGVYNVIVSQGANVKSLRMIKR